MIRSGSRIWLSACVHGYTIAGAVLGLAAVLQAAERQGEARGLRMAGIVSKPTRAADLRALLARLAEAA